MTDDMTAEIIRLSRQVSAHPPEATVRMARLCLLDWIGVSVAGSRDPLVDILIDDALQDGGHPQSTLIGRARKVSLRQAAFINGAAGHALDYDDTSLRMRAHPSVVLWPALLAIAEHRALSGAAVLQAFICGYEAGAMIGHIIGPRHYRKGFHATGTIGTFAATAAIAHLMALTPDQTARAYGIAASQASGLKGQFGTMCKPFHAGRAAENGLLAVRLAERGFTSPFDALERPQGFFDTQCDDAPIEPLTWGAYALDNNLFKFHAACFGTHGTLEAARNLKRSGLDPDEIDHITLIVDAGADRMCNIAEPATETEAKFSLRLAAALGLLGYDTRRPGTYSDALTRQPDLVRLRDKTRVELAQPIWPEDLTEVRVRLRDGTERMARHDISVPLESLDMTAERVVEKFISLTGGGFDDGQQRALIETIAYVPDVPDAQSLQTILAMCGLATGA